MPPHSEAVLFFLSDNPTKPVNLVQPTAIINKGVVVDRGVFFSTGEYLGLATMIFFFGLLSHGPISQLILLVSTQLRKGVFSEKDDDADFIR